eukprot:TRINITY_DN32955_c0_g1_i1.p1 TRINITY_DN32955_c0_g1~~TRINITY_DN32955_c0_g1_i1.p1  ORF type:complete len:509 (+),score=158.49 TRINITY_DN32955_c0_g1_i1:81-1529(+)
MSAVARSPRSEEVRKVDLDDARTEYTEMIGSVEWEHGKIGPTQVTGFEGTNFSGRPLAIITVGLPGRGKSYISRRLARFLSWLGLTSCIFQVPHTGTGDYFDHTNKEHSSQRDRMVSNTLAEMIQWMRTKQGKVGILDGQNVAASRRHQLKSALRSVLDDDRIVFLEVGERDIAKLEKYKEMTLNSSEEYREMAPKDACVEFDRRQKYYMSAYEPVSREECFIKMMDGGAELEINKIRGYVPCRVVNFLLNVNLSMKPIFLSRHGQSEFNLMGRIGGDSGLTGFGEQYAQELSRWIKESAPAGLEVWCSTLLRTRMTATPLLESHQVVYWRSLEEIDAGIYDGLTYEEIQEQAEEEFLKRKKNKYWYRYPQGESYHDLVCRLEPVIMEMERSKKPLLIISHQAVLRVIYSYLIDSRPEKCTNQSMPLHTVIKVNPTYGGRFEEERFPILETDPTVANVGTHGAEDVAVEQQQHADPNAAPSK